MRALIASILIGGLFGSATATVEETGDDVMVVDIEVEVQPGAATVVAHLTWEAHELILPLLDRGEGVYGITTELPPRNYVVVFEAIGEVIESSDPVSLEEMGADLVAGSGGTLTTLEDDEDFSPETSQMLWLAVALGAASLSALAFWVLGGREDEEEVEDEEEDTEDEASHEEGANSDPVGHP